MKFNTILKGLCALFSLLLTFSAAMTGTCAWRDITQHKSNEFYGRGTTQPDTATTEPDTTTTEPDETTTESDTTTTEPTTPESTTITKTTTITTTSTTPAITTTTTTQPTTQPSTATTDTTTQPTTQPPTSTAATTTIATTTKPPGGPKTGDTGSVWLWAIITVVSAICLRGVLLWGKKGRRGEAEIGGLL